MNARSLSRPFFAACACAALAAFVAFASFAPLCHAAATVNVDELPHKTYPLPNGSHYTVITYGDHNWREVEPSVLAGMEVSDPDVCFEAKFDMAIPPDKIKLFGLPGTLVVEDSARFKALSAELKRNDNVWFAGELRKNRATRAVELRIVHALRQPPDVEKFELRIASLRKARDFETLIETGHKIEQQRTSANLGGINEFDKLGMLRNKAFEAGLNLKEASLKRDDADGLFAVALQWRELLHRNYKFRELVERVLKIDPNHPRAQRFAEELDLERFEDVWLRKDEVARIREQRKQDQERLDTAQKAELEAKKMQLERAVAERPLLLNRSRASLRAADPQARRAAIASLGEAAGNSPDVEFSRQAVDILVNLADPAAVSPGLEQAAQSVHPEVRRIIFEALAWRGTQDQTSALDVLAAALRREKDAAVARSGVDALVALGGKPAVSTLIACLPAGDHEVLDEIVEGLKLAARQPLSTREGWQDWWAKNKNSFPAN